MRKFLRVSVGCGLIVACLTGIRGHAQQRDTGQPAQQQPGQPQPDAQPPVFRTGINFVRVDVIVTDKNGNPIGDLKPEDFEVVEEGKPQKIETFKLVSLDDGRGPRPDGPPREIRTDFDEESEAARDDVRLFAIFLDDYHVTQEGSLSAREQIARFVQTQLVDSDMVGLMYPLDATATVRMTRNHAAIVKGVQQFLGRKYDYTPRNSFEERYAYYPAETVERVRNQVSLSALKALIMHMGGLKEGRKALILVSEGFTNMLPPQMRDPVAAIPGLGNNARNDPSAGVNNPLENRAAFSASMDLEQDLREVYATANRNNTAIYAVDPRGLSTGEFGADRNIGAQLSRQYLNSTIDTLRTLALETDGRAIVNRNDLTAGMKQIVRDTSAYYLLGYNSTLAPTDGKFHEIKVRVKRPGVQVRARKGYWAYTADDAAKALAPPKPGPPKAVETALSTIASPARARVVRTWIGTERGTNGKTRVTFVWEPAPKTPGEPARNSSVPARVSLIAVAPDGSPYFRGRVPGAAATPSAPSRVTFEVQPGKMQLRLSIEGESSEVIDSEVRDVDVPDLAAGQTSLGTPEVFRGRTVREIQQLKADAQATPAAGREFSRTDRLFLRVPAYGRDGTVPKVMGKLLNRAGQPMVELIVTSSAVRVGVGEIDVPLAALPPGDYLIEITATGDGGDVKQLVGFRVVG
jgi:VWFA-related protein